MSALSFTPASALRAGVVAAAAAFAKNSVVLQPVCTPAAGGAALQFTTTDGMVLSSTAAALVYLLAASAEGKPLSLDAQHWIALASNTLLPAVETLAAAATKPDIAALRAAGSVTADACTSASTPEAAAACIVLGLTQLEAALAGGRTVLVGDAPTVADAAVAATLLAAQNAGVLTLASVSAPLAAYVSTTAALPVDGALAGALAAVTAAAATVAPAAPSGKAAAGKGGKAGGAAAAAGAGDKPAAAAGGKGGKGAKGDAAAAAAPVVVDFAKQVSPVCADCHNDAEMRTPLLAMLTDMFTRAMHAAFPVSAEAGMVADVVLNENTKFPHQYQFNSSMQLAGRLRGKPGAPASPRAAADGVLAVLSSWAPSPAIARLEVSGPGYINVYIATNYMATRIAHVLLYKVRPGTPAKRHRVVVDYSSPNIAKEMHIGHLRSTIIGDTIAKILEFAGHDVLRVNHVGDWGTQFGMLIAHLKDMQARGESISVDMGGLTAFYKAAKVRFDTEPEFKERAHKEVVALQAGDATNLELWRSMVKLSQATYDEVYQRLQVDPRLELCGESFYNDKIAPIIAELEGSGRAVISEGALIVPVPGSEVPLMLRKSDGGFGYDSTDLAAIRYRLHTLKADVLVYVVDAGQSLHFELVFKGAQQAGWYNPAETRVVHTGFGVIQGDDRKKFKTRSGDTVRLVDVLDEAKARALKQIRDREAAKEEGERATEETMQNTASVLGYGGVKYFDLRQHRNTDYVFNYDRMLSADGDTAVYLEYAHVRLCSILRKAAGMGLDVDAIKNRIETEGLAFQHTTEVALVTKLLCFQDVIAAVERDLTPHYLCEYLYHVANLAAEFTRDCNVLGATTPAPVRDSRLRIVAATVDTLAQGLRLLGITPLDRI